MKCGRKILVFLWALTMLAQTGCSAAEGTDRVNTVVWIPLNPTEIQETIPETETTSGAEETVPESQEIQETTAKEKKKQTSSSKKKSTSTKPAGTNTKPTGTNTKSTEPPTTEAKPEETVAEETTGTEPIETQPEETEAPKPGDYTVGSLEYAILDEINAYRAEAGVPELTLSRKLCGIAAIRAEEVSRVWSHNRPDGRGYATAMTDNGYGYSISAENLVYVSGSGSGAAIVSKWMNGDNRESLLSPDFTTAGIGVYRSGGVTYVANLLVG